MIAKAIGYLFYLALLTPFLGSVYFVYDRVSILTVGEFNPAQISECYHQYTSSGSSSRGSWGPVAKTKDNITIKGGFRWSTKSWCTSDIDKSVSVILHPTNPEKHRIHTFFQFYFYPLICIALSIALGYMIHKKARSSKSEKSDPN